MTNSAVDVFKYIDMTPGPDKCWPWKRALAANGRPYFTVGGKKRLAYDVARELVSGVSLQRNEVNRHTCDHEWCCNPHHVVPGTHQENMNDMKERERHGLPKTVVNAIRALIAKGRDQEAIADIYGVSRETISAIATGRVYKHVPSENSEDA